MTSKNERPIYHMLIVNGKMVPATAYDEERLFTYRANTRVRVQITELRDRPMIRRWWQVLGLVLKQCKTPWQTKDEASEAIKLALGIVSIGKTRHGDYMQYPRSLTELDDVELDSAVDMMIELLSRMTGVDVAELKKEAGAADPPDDDEDDQTEAQDETIVYDSVTGEILDGEILTDEPNDGTAEPPAEASSEPGEDASADAPSPGDPLPLLLRYARDVLSLAKNDQPSATIVAVEKRYVAQMDDAEKETARIIATTIRNFRNGKFRYDEAREKIASAGGWNPTELGGDNG